MDKRFSNLFGLTEEQAISLLDTPLDQLAEDDSRYVAASELVNFATEPSINALIRAVQNTDPSLDNRIVRRKSVESLGKLQAKQGLSAIRACLADEDCYLVENAVWAIGEIGTQDSEILEEIAQLLEKPGQTYRVMIHTLAKLDYPPAVERIRKFVDATDKPTASAAISAVCRFTGDYSPIEKVLALLQHPNVYARRLCIQDLIDARYYAAIPLIAQCPVSLVFRLRGIRLLAEAGIPAGAIAFTEIQPSLEQVIFDHPRDLKLVHAYEQTPTLELLIRELYDTDFGRCYLATKTILEAYPDSAGEALMATYAAEAYNDYGAHYHVMKLLGWLKYAPGYDLLVEALNNREPQFQKSRAGAAIALGELGDTSAIPALKAVLETKIWDLKYAALMALEKLADTNAHAIAANDQNWLVRAKATHTPASSNIINP
ncbi:HEAT repeat domain-containing protein [Scytonema tolypothrichoides VB-61278]|nr:HEAT repeat domain-containing protein [Scytonema tolypothrichoides VB-61278]